MNTKALFILLLCALGQGSSIPPYTTPLWRTFLDGTTAEFQADSDSTTFFQILDADGGTPVLNADTKSSNITIQEIKIWPRKPQVLVTFSFDDGYATDYTVMKPVFDAQGEVACSAVVTSNINTGAWMTSAQLVELETAGWEILSHSKDHFDLTAVSEADLRIQLSDSQTSLIGWGVTGKNLVYPGYLSNESVRRITREYYRSAIGQTGTTHKILDTYNLRRRTNDNHTLLATYQGYVDDAETNLSWLIFGAHETDSDDVTTMNSLIDYIQAKNILIVTVEQALNLIGNSVDIGEDVALSERGLRAENFSGPINILSTDETDQISIYHDNVTAWIKTTDGPFGFMTDEGTNTNSYLEVKGKGTGVGYLRIYNEDDSVWLGPRTFGGICYFSLDGTLPGGSHIAFEHDAEAYVSFYESSSEGETQELRIYGFRTGDSNRSLDISVGIDAADTASFDGVSNYWLRGNLKIGEGTAATDYTLTFDGETNDGLITWMEDEDYFKFSDDVVAETVSTPQNTTTLGVGVATFAITSNVVTLTGDGGGNTVTTITGAKDGQLLTIIFVDANVTMSNDDTHAANTLDLNGNLTSADDTVIQMVFDGTSFYEVSRSVN